VGGCWALADEQAQPKKSPPNQRPAVGAGAKGLAVAVAGRAVNLGEGLTLVAVPARVGLRVVYRGQLVAVVLAAAPPHHGRVGRLVPVLEPALALIGDRGRVPVLALEPVPPPVAARRAQVGGEPVAGGWLNLLAPARAGQQRPHPPPKAVAGGIKEACRSQVAALMLRTKA
jgi:hypothetical protein